MFLLILLQWNHGHLLAPPLLLTTANGLLLFILYIIYIALKQKINSVNSWDTYPVHNSLIYWVGGWTIFSFFRLRCGIHERAI